MTENRKTVWENIPLLNNGDCPIVTANMRKFIGSSERTKDKQTKPRFLSSVSYKRNRNLLSTKKKKKKKFQRSNFTRWEGNIFGYPAGNVIT